MERFGNQCLTTVGVGGYTSGSGVLNVVSTASPWPQNGTFTIELQNSSSFTLLRVTGINSSTQWAVTAEINDANASAGTVVLGTVISAAAISQLSTDIQNTPNISAVAVTERHIFVTAETYNFVHNLNCDVPLISFRVYSGTANYEASVVDSNTVSVTTNGPLELSCTFLTGGTTVFTPAQDFTPSLNEYSFSVAAGKTHHITLTQVAASNGSGTVTYSVTNAPTGATFIFSANPLTGGANVTQTTDIAIHLDTSTPTGLVTLHITGSNGLLSHTVDYDLTVLVAGSESVVYSNAGPVSETGNDSGPPNSFVYNVTAENAFDVEFTTSTNATGGNLTRLKQIFSMINGSTDVLTLWYNPPADGTTLTVKLGTTTVTTINPGSYLTGTNTTFRCKLFIDSAFGMLQIWVNGVSVYSHLNFDSTVGGTLTTIDTFRWYSPTPFFTNTYTNITIWDF